MAAMTGRGKAKLTAKLRNELCDHLRTGMPIVFACARVGIHKTTYFKWVRRGEDARALVEEGHDVAADERAYAVFVDSVELARNFGGGWLYEQLLAAPANIWQKYSAAIERQFHDVWSTKYGATGYTMNVDKKNGTVEVKLSFELDSEAAEELREH